MTNPPNESTPRESAKILQFPLPFGEDTRAVSNPLARCALFAPVKERQHFKDYVAVGEVNGIKIEYAGEQLNQDDHDTLIQLVKMARNRVFGETICVPVNAVLLGIGRSTHQEQRRQLFQQTSRLVRGTVRITTPQGRIEAHLLNDVITPHDQETSPQYRRRLAYSLNAKLIPFYAHDALTLFNSDERIRLKGRGSELAKWLHGWIIGHAIQYPHKVETIRRLCGSQLKDLKLFRRQLCRALDLLKEVGIITAGRIDEADLVHIERTPSAAQQRHLERAEQHEPRKQATARRDMEAVASQAPPSAETLKPETIERFRALYPRLDVYACQADFDAWANGRPLSRNYDAAFLGFAKKWVLGKV